MNKTIPETPVPGERFLEAATWNLWTVYDWQYSVCPCMGYAREPETGRPLPNPACPDCGGTGNGPLEPCHLASGLDESDARLLAFGPDLLAACRDAREVFEHEYGGRSLCIQLAAAIAKATETPP